MTPQSNNRQNAIRRSKLVRGAVVLTFLAVLCGYFVTSCSKAPPSIDDDKSPYKPLIEESTVTDAMENVDFAKFKHDSTRHKDLPCLLCHQRNDDSTKVGFAPHVSCAGCHTQQFDDKSHQICQICHEEQGSEKLKPFPPIRSFSVKFDHKAHFSEANCATCHRPQGAGMSVPAAANDAHATCFQCHSAAKTVGENNIGKCSTCHELGPRNPINDSTAAIGFNFDHAKHGKLDCNSCHNPQGGNAMSAINVAMHAGAANSCATCHNGSRAFGANNFSNCRQCHSEMGGAKTVGIKFSHASHTKSNCSICHKPAGKTGNFVVPDGQSAHSTCFQCHSPNKGGGSFTSGKCFTCHQIGGTNTISASSPVIPGNFAHTKHSFMDCDSCHTSSNGVMSAPSVLMHKAPKSGTNCATCHNNEMAFGEDFTNCKRCHTGNTFKK
ncbi:MAG: cytochrome c3 family protein [Acidobacteria bacterium]|nr:cytochrome c3 family protein [Acidobacteriota bacterium]